ncbi:hypothetical protein KFE25_011156 [Diacronema lutheri]|uniref:mRNA stability protein n=2 Tax=Diacronema lutheri TaxID=2081491 RepID=A0A8J5XM53_DIALT|nr:hypothetical protein KFE25_011156 [Diacronema lutheri]
MADAEAAPTDEADLALQAELDAEAALMRKYGGLPRSNPLIAHSLKGGKHYFDSGDYALQQNGLHTDADLPTGDLSQLPLAYDHHAHANIEADSKLTTQPPRLDKRPGVTSPRGAVGGKGRSGPASPRGVGGVGHAGGAGPSGA